MFITTENGFDLKIFNNLQVEKSNQVKIQTQSRFYNV